MLQIDPNIVRKALVDVYMTAYEEVMLERGLDKSIDMIETKRLLKTKLEEHFGNLPDASIMLVFLLTDDEIRKKAKSEATASIDSDLLDMLRNESPTNVKVI